MSFIIDGEFIKYQTQTIYSYNQNHKVNRSQIQFNNQEKTDVLKLVNQIFGKNIFLEYVPTIFTDLHQQEVICNIILTSLIINNLSFSLRLYFNFKDRSINFFIILWKNSKPFRIQTHAQRIIVCKVFSKSSFNVVNAVCTSMDTGQISIKRPKLNCDDVFSNLIEFKSRKQKFFSLFKSAFSDCLNISKKLTKLLYRPTHQTFQEMRKRCHQGPSQTIFPYVIQSTIQPAFECQLSYGMYETMQINRKKQIGQIKQKLQFLVHEYQQYLTCSLYEMPDFPINKARSRFNKDFFFYNDNELKKLKQKALPPVMRSAFGSQQKYIFNLIQINDQIPLNLQHINNGGFSSIKVAVVDVSYIKSFDMTVNKMKFPKNSFSKQNFMNDSHLKKRLAFKVNTCKQGPSYRDRIKHELQIVSRFKGVDSMFLPQYYRIVNANSPYSVHLLMQYLPYPTLCEYVRNSGSMLSIFTKLHLALMIVHGLGFIKDHQVVHMDLKPMNIIVTRQLMIKLIDFGQSVVKNSQQNKFRPAFTLPYGCPEIFDPKLQLQFNQKSDVFSWGVILFQLIFNDLPFCSSNEKLVKMFMNKQYLNCMYFVPEEQSKYGCQQIMPLLRLLLLRCFDKNSQNRPYTFWLAIILKQCLNYLINNQSISVN